MKVKMHILVGIIMMVSLLTTSCWNYKEIDKLSIVTGVAVDKMPNDQYQLTVEIVKPSGGKEIENMSEIVSLEGKTLFDAARNLITITGGRLYWPHAKVIIVSKEIAEERVMNGLEWYNRDAETRVDISILISREATARQILEEGHSKEKVRSFILEEIIKNQESLSKAPYTDVIHFDIQSKTKGISPIIPTVKLNIQDDQVIPQVMGTAIIQTDKLVGFLSGEETKTLMFIVDKVDGGLLIEEVEWENELTDISLEIFKNKTKITVHEVNGRIQIYIDMDTEVSIGEIMGVTDLINEKGIKKIEDSAQNALEDRIEVLIKKIQSEYGTDIFGFASKLQEDEPELWKRIENDWDKVFKDIDVQANSKITIKNSAILSKTLESR